jgi:hypothetical protein
MNEKYIDKIEICNKAKLNWDKKSKEEKSKVGTKYKHIFDKHKLQSVDWSNNFDNLTKHQQNVLIKGELIRTYDSLPNIEKTCIMRKFGLSMFSSKWYKLPSKDKKTLLNCIIK